MFVELFAGKGLLSNAVVKEGVPTMKPDDLASGGTDFADHKEVEQLKTRLLEWHEQGSRFVIHLAPPCSTFSRVRDRSAKTRLRSPEFPEGLDSKNEQVTYANRVADNAYGSARWAAQPPLLAAVTVENPAKSYFWDYVGKLGAEEEFVDVIFSQCRFGTPYKKTPVCDVGIARWTSWTNDARWLAPPLRVAGPDHRDM